MKKKFSLVFLMAGLLAAAPVMADKPGKSERGDYRGEPRGEQRAEQRDNRQHDNDRDHGRDDDKSERKSQQYYAGGKQHFEQSQYAMVRDYYGEHYQGRRCPPGLAKKHNGCMPPGQAKKWELGRPLPRDVIYYSVPAPLVVQIGQPPFGHRYVRVAGDILMIAIGTGLVVDAIQDLGGM